MYPASKINVPALGMACAAALALTLGVPFAMQHEAGEQQVVTVPHTDVGVAPATEVANLAPNTIEVVVVGQRPQHRRWWAEVVHKRTT